MRFPFSFLIVLILSLALTSCTDNALLAPDASTPANTEDPSNVAAHSAGPDAVLTPGLQNMSKRRPTSASVGFASPLFGLATAPNGDIVVADAGAGISTVDGATDIPFPGVTDMSPIGRGSMWALKGLTADPGDDTDQGLYRTSRGTTRLVADLFAFENNNNPDGADVIDSNPFEVYSENGREAIVADAGGNDLLRITNQGEIEVMAVFPTELVSTSNLKILYGCPNGPAEICDDLPSQLPAQPVPTSIARGPHGYYYVGELKGFPAPANASNIWKVAPDASGATCGSSPDCVKAFDGGFTSIIDLTFDAEGTLHVAELDEDSWFALEILNPAVLTGGTVNACALTTTTCTQVASEIPMLTAITFGADGSLWATKDALVPGAASVMQVP